MRATTTIVIFLTALGGAGVATATAADRPNARYTMTPTDGGFIRMDTQSGVLSFCGKAAGTLACKIVPDDKIAMQSDMDKLAKANKELKEENRRLEEMLLGDGKPGGIVPGGKFKLPTEKDVDKALSYLQGMYKKFRDKLRELEQQRPDSKPTPL